MPEFIASTRAEGRKLGERHYFTGIPCKHEHVSHRFVKTAQCFECKRLDGLTPNHKKRLREYQARAENKRAQKNRALKSQYGITVDAYEAMIAAANGHCPACDIHFETKKGPNCAVVDHCHDTGKVRGVLCNRCNAALGMMKDSEKVILGVLKYLRGANARI